jgi:membrane protein DedA with SNARE-associated domain
MLERVGVRRERIEALATWLRRTGARGVAVSRMTPGVRVGSIAASGVADLPLPVFVRGLVVGNAVFVSAHYGLGVLLGASAGRFIGEVGASLLPIAIGVVVLAIIGAAGWTLLRRRRRRRGDCPTPYAAWADAACPACLALALFDDPDARGK